MIYNSLNVKPDKVLKSRDYLLVYNNIEDIINIKIDRKIFDKINIDIKSNQIKQNIIEVLTSLNLKPKKESIDKINTKIVLATIIEMDSQNFKKTEIEKIVLIDVPSQIYGEIRKIFISLFESSGFKDIKINEKIDFKKLYDLKKSQ